MAKEDRKVIKNGLEKWRRNITINGKKYQLEVVLLHKSSKRVVTEALDNKEIEKIKELNSNLSITSKSLTVDDFFKDTIIERRDSVAYGVTTEAERLFINHIRPKIGHIKMRQLKDTDIENLYKTLIDEDHSGHFLTTMNKNVSVILRVARERRIMDHNPISAYAKAMVVAHVKKTRKPLTKNQRANLSTKLMDAMDKGFADIDRQEIAKGKEFSTYQLMFRLLAFQGLRISEGSGVTLDNIDREHGTLTIEKQKYFRSPFRLSPADAPTGMVEHELKTASSRRTVPISSRVLELIQELPYADGEIAQLPPYKNKKLGRRPISGHLFRKKFDQVKKMVADQGIAGTDGLTPHDCRRYYGSLLIMSGESYLTVSKRMGHSNPSITMREYATEISKVDSSNFDAGELTLGKAESWQIPDMVESIS